MSLNPKEKDSAHGFEQSDDSEEEEPEINKKPVIKKPANKKLGSQFDELGFRKVSTSDIQTELFKSGDLKRISEVTHDEYDFGQYTKRSKPSQTVVSIKKVSTKTTFRQRAPLTKPGSLPRAYNHRWGSNDDEEEEEKKQRHESKDHRASSSSSSSSSSNGAMLAPSSSSLTKIDYSRPRGGTISTSVKSTTLRLVRKAKQCMESGEARDFHDDLEYFMDTFSINDVPLNLKCLNMSKMTKRSAAFGFRQYFRTQPNKFQSLLTCLKDAHESPSLSICIAGFFYMFARDSGQFPGRIVPIKLLFEFLKQDKHPTSDSDYSGYQESTWEVLEEWKEECEQRKQRPIIFDLNKKNTTTGYLSLVTLDYVMARAPSQNKRLQSDLLTSGILQLLIAKVDKLVLSLKLLRNPTNEILTQHLCELEHSFRIIENGIMLDKKNQAFVTGHRNGIILFSCEKYLDYFCQEISKYEVGSPISKKLFDVLDLMFRLAMNASHSNEVCSLKLGQIGNFLSSSVGVLCNHLPRYIEQERYIDFSLLILGLLVNLTEKSAANRRKVCNLKLDTNDPREESTLDFLTLLFVKHENQAKTVDEELDNELMEEVIEDENGSGNEEEEDSQRLNRPSDMNEDEIINALNSAMKKANTHMQDSMMASYIGLLIGCLIQTDEDLAAKVRVLIPSNNFSGILEQLERFKEFAELTKIVDLSCITNIIQSLRVVDVPNSETATTSGAS